MKLLRCRSCVMPLTRPDTAHIDGECSACVAYRAREQINWRQRKGVLLEILETTKRNSTGYDCIVPSSGGKDSHYQTLRLIELGVRPLVVTASTCHLTKVGRANIANLARYATTIELTPNRRVRQELNRAGLELVGDISWPEHASIFSTPLRVACALGIPLVFYGENPQNQYGGPLGSGDAAMMTRRWISEFGGFLGLRTKDFVGRDGITAAAMADYQAPSEQAIDKIGLRAYFLGYFEPWDSLGNASTAVAAGMRGMPDGLPPTKGNRWEFENLDNAQTGIHDYFAWLKYAFGRGCAQISVDVRAGRIKREDALAWVEAHDGLFPWTYADVSVHDMLAAIGMKFSELLECARRFQNRDLCWRALPEEQ